MRRRYYRIFDDFRMAFSPVCEALDHDPTNPAFWIRARSSLSRVPFFRPSVGWGPVGLGCHRPGPPSLRFFWRPVFRTFLRQSISDLVSRKRHHGRPRRDVPRFHRDRTYERGDPVAFGRIRVSGTDGEGIHDTIEAGQAVGDYFYFGPKGPDGLMPEVFERYVYVDNMFRKILGGGSRTARRVWSAGQRVHGAGSPSVRVDQKQIECAVRSPGPLDLRTSSCEWTTTSSTWSA